MQGLCLCCIETYFNNRCICMWGWVGFFFLHFWWSSNISEQNNLIKRYFDKWYTLNVCFIYTLLLTVFLFKLLQVVGLYLSCVHISILICDNIFSLVKDMLRNFPSVVTEKWALCQAKLQHSAGRIQEIYIGSESWACLIFSKSYCMYSW
jgi:hypothetical protein